MYQPSKLLNINDCKKYGQWVISSAAKRTEDHRTEVGSLEKISEIIEIWCQCSPSQCKHRHLDHRCWCSSSTSSTPSNHYGSVPKTLLGKMACVLASRDLQLHACDLKEQQAGTPWVHMCNFTGVSPCLLHRGLQGAALAYVVLEHLHLPWRGVHVGTTPYRERQVGNSQSLWGVCWSGACSHVNVHVSACIQVWLELLRICFRRLFRNL